MEFDMDSFLENPSWEVFDRLKKNDLLKLSDHFEADAKPAMRKQIVKNIIIQILVDENIFDEDALEYMVEPHTGNDAFELKKLEMEMHERLETQKLDRELERQERLETQKVDKEMQERLETKKLELKKVKIEKELEMHKEIELKKLELELEKVNTQKQPGSGFDATKFVRFVPKFHDTEVDKYFLHFEKIAISLKWPKDVWTLLLQSALTGKAREIFSAMSIDQSSDYTVLKQAILKAYELVPEAYRQKFRSTQKLSDQTHVEFARVKEQLLNRWLAAKDVDNDFEQFRQLVLIEEFKQCIHVDVRTHLDEAKIDSINKAATLADDYSLTHKLSYTSAKPNYSNRKPWQNKQPSSHPQASTNYRGEKPKLDTGTYNKASDSSGYRNFGKASKSEHELNCTYCKKPGHLVSRCWKLHGKPNACVVPQRATTVKAQTKPVKLVTEVSDDFKPFVMQGHVSLIGDETNLQPIVIMRDTGCAQTLILEDALPLSEKSYTNTDVLIKGVGMEYSKVPLHKILLKSGLVSGLVTVGVRPKLPIEGVSMLLGNDLAGVKVIPDPIVTTEPSVKEDNEEEKKLFPACAITRAMTKQISQEEITDVVKPTNKTPNRPKQINEINLDLEDTFFATLDDSVQAKVSEVNYVVKTPDRRKQRQLCHINMLKRYVDRSDPSTTKPVAISVSEQDGDEIIQNGVTKSTQNHKTGDNPKTEYQPKVANSDVLKNLDTKLGHLDKSQQDQLTSLIHKYDNLFSDVPTKTDVVYHDIEIDGATPIKQHPYRLNPEKTKHLKAEVQYMLENNIIEPSHSNWSSPCVMVPKPDGSYRVCQDFRAINLKSKTDTYPIPRIDDCIDKIGHTKFVSKFDLLKGYWQVPLTERAKEISAFVTPDGLYQYTVMPFGLKNAPATFQRLVNNIIAEVEGCEAYIDDLVVYSETWENHLDQLHQLFDRLSKANLTVNLAKSDFCCATVSYLGHVVGQGQVKPIQAKVEAIDKFPPPTNKKELMRFLGMAGYYRKYCPNFSVIANPMTNLLKKNSKFIWTNACQEAFDKIKAILMNSPVLTAPNFNNQFKLMVDASDVGCGAVLTQEVEDKIDHPVCYFSKKFDKHQQNYSTIEKECLAMLLALQHFEVYVSTPTHPVLVFTDHNPLTFLHKMRNKNRRLLRWSLYMQEYNLDIQHIKGRDNVIADALSRI